jgi:hypothetical protein
MSGRPEGSNGGYDDVQADHSAIQDFTPWRTGDKTDRDRAEVPSRDPIGHFQWTERQPDVFQDGDRVRSTRPVGGLLGSAVPADSIGQVESTRMGLLGDVHITVRFSSGYVEEVKPDDIQRASWFD